MGCDIHAYIEYAYKDDKRPVKYWMNFAGSINPGRNYLMFGILANVRCETEFHFEPKGIPTDELGFCTRDDLYLFISDSDDEGTCTLEKAKEWNEHYNCKIINDKDGKPFLIEHPDWHSHSWLTVEEYEKAISQYKIECEKHGYHGVGVEYQAILAAMKSIESYNYDVRLVFWFDN